MNLILGLFMSALAQQTDRAALNLVRSRQCARHGQLFIEKAVWASRILIVLPHDSNLDICQLRLVKILSCCIDIILGVWRYGNSLAKHRLQYSGGSTCSNKRLFFRFFLSRIQVHELLVLLEGTKRARSLLLLIKICFRLIEEQLSSLCVN